MVYSHVFKNATIGPNLQPWLKKNMAIDPQELLSCNISHVCKRGYSCVFRVYSHVLEMWLQPLFLVVKILVLVIFLPIFSFVGYHFKFQTLIGFIYKSYRRVMRWKHHLKLKFCFNYTYYYSVRTLIRHLWESPKIYKATIDYLMRLSQLV